MECNVLLKKSLKMKVFDLRSNTVLNLDQNSKDFDLPWPGLFKRWITVSTG